jgi:hypothetical protein
MAFSAGEMLQEGPKMTLGQDANGVYKLLDDGRVLRIRKRLYNTLLSLSSSQQDQGWSEGW